jgi:hypothetical protein
MRLDKDGVKYGACISWRDSYHLRICHETRTKKHNPLIIKPA